MRPHVLFAFILLYLQVLLANCSHKDAFPVATNTTVKTDALNSATSNSKHTCTSNRCLRKCCKKNEVFDWMNSSCLPDSDNRLQKAGWSERFAGFEIVYNSRCAGSAVSLDPSIETDKYDLFTNGSIFSLDHLISYDNYCMDYLTEYGMIEPVICFEEVFGSEEESREKFIFLLYSSGLGISNVFLTVTLALYLLTPRLRKKVHDKCFLCHVVTLIIGFSSLICIQHIDVQTPACAFLSYMCQFWLLASFFWLNIMCIDMWRTVGNMQTTKESNVRKLLLYCLYAWGCPCLILIFSLSADNFLPNSNPFRTGFGEETCWFRRNKGDNSWVDPRYVHFYGIVSLTLLVNIYTFVDTALLIKFQNKLWKKNKNTESKRHRPRSNTRVILYLKLFIVMGLYWMMEVISYHSDGDNLFWNTVDFINTLQGVFIFIIFICNKRALMILNKRFFPRKVFLKEYNRTYSDRHRSTCSKTSKASFSEDTTYTSSLMRTNVGNGGQKLNDVFVSNKSDVHF